MARWSLTTVTVKLWVTWAVAGPDVGLRSAVIDRRSDVALVTAVSNKLPVELGLE